MLALSESEYQVAVLVSQDLHTKEIAKRLDKSEQTIKNQLTTIIQKLEVNSRVGIAVKAVSLGYNGLRTPERSTELSEANLEA